MFGPDPEARKMASITPREEVSGDGIGCAVVAAAAVMLAGAAFAFNRCSTGVEAPKDPSPIKAPQQQEPGAKEPPMPPVSDVIKRNP